MLFIKNVALVTGGSRGIGKAISISLAKEGYIVAINYCNNDEKAKDVLEEIRSFGGVASLIKGDISSASVCKEIVRKCIDDFGHISLLVNNAGIARTALLTDFDDEEQDKMMNTNLNSAITLSRLVLPEMIKRKTGNIINISSIWGEVGSSCEVIYSSAKAGIIGLTKALAKEVGPSGIRVNCVSPGLTDTEMNDNLSEEEKQAFIDDNPIREIIKPEDIASAVVFLASEKAKFITGQVLSVSGGQVI